MVSNNKVTVITPSDKSILPNFRQMWLYRDLLQTFTWRDIQVRYKQTILGVMWVILQPVATMIIFAFFFGRVAKIPSNNLPYSLFVLTGLVLWNFFSSTLSQASSSLVDNESLIKKAYFPRMLLPMSAMFTATVDLGINLIVLILFSLFLKTPPSIWFFVYLLPAYLLTGLSALGCGLFMSALNVKYRDVRYILPFAFQILLFLSPIIYPINIVSPLNQLFIALNPLTTAIELLRSTFGNSSALSQPIIIFISVVSCVVYIIIGNLYFLKTESLFADIA